jgi:hypothetical protein
MAKTQLFGQWAQGSLVITDEGFSTGARFFVHNATGTDGAGFGSAPGSPFKTLDYAVGKCTADAGDIIYVMPGHSEVLAAANGVDVDVAGVRVVGLGIGDNRPHFHFTATDSTFAIGAAGVTVENLRFLAGISAVVVGVDVEAAGTGFTIKNCEFYYGGTTTWDFVLALQLMVGADRATIIGNRFLGEPAVAGCASAIKLTGAVHNVRIQGNEFVGDYDPAAINGITTISQHLMVLDNLVYTTNAAEPYLEVFSGTTGIIAGTRGCAAGATIAANAVADAMVHVENYVGNTTGTIPIIKGAGGSPALDAD